MRVVIIGGGIAGLAAGSELVAAGAGVTLRETADRLGGQIRTTRQEGFVVEEGADTFGIDADEGIAWAKALGLAPQLVTLRDEPTLTLLNGSLDRVASGCAAALLGVPAYNGTAAPPITTVADGMDALVEAAAAALGDEAEVRTGNGAVALGHDEHGWQVFPEMGPAIRAEALVFALPPKAAAWLIHPLHPQAARHLTTFTGRSIIVVSLAFRREDVAHPLDAMGFTVPMRPSGSGLVTCGFTSTQFPHRAPEGTVLLRALLRPARGELAYTTDAEWEIKTTRLLEPILGIRRDPMMAWVTRWPEIVADPAPEAAEHVTQAREQLGAIGPVAFAGGAYQNPSISGGIRSGRAAAAGLLANVGVS